MSYIGLSYAAHISSRHAVQKASLVYHFYLRDILHYAQQRAIIYDAPMPSLLPTSMLTL